MADTRSRSVPVRGTTRTESQQQFQQHFDVWNEVPLVPQLTGMSCWAAAAAMIVGWRDRLAVRPDEVATGSGRWGAYEEGLLPTDVESLAATFHLELEPPRAWDVETLRRRLEEVGPLWLGEASPGLHSIVVTGIFGDGSDDGTFVRINDPWPVGRGERYLLTFRSLMQNLSAASALVGGQGQVLHSGGRGRGRGASRSSYDASYSRTTVATGSSDAPSAKGRGNDDNYGNGGTAVNERYISSSTLGTDPLRSHGGTGENLYLAWSGVEATTTVVDVVIHLHGYSSLAPTRGLLNYVVGLTHFNPALGGRGRPTVAILPRGRKITPEEVAAETAARLRAHNPDPINPDRYSFPGLQAGSGQGLETLAAESLQWIARQGLGRSTGTLAINRLILTAHSGGGAPLNALLRHHASRRICDPHEVFVYDALYGAVDGLTDWAAHRVRRHRAATAATAAAESGALRVVHRGGTAEGSRAVTAALAPAGLVGDAPAAIARCYRAQLTSVQHDDIPGRFGPLFLVDAGAELPAPPAPAPARRRPTAMPHGLDAEEHQEERYGIPLGIFRYYATKAGASAARPPAPRLFRGSLAERRPAAPAMPRGSGMPDPSRW